MHQDKYTMFSNRLAKVYAHRRKKAKTQHVSCYRLYDLDLPEFPFAIDLYEDHLHAAEYQRNHTLTEDEHKTWLEQSSMCMAQVLNVPLDNIHIKQRAVITDRKEQYGKLDAVSVKRVVQENGLKFQINLSDYLDTGLFLDHRPTRAMVREISAGKSVLNLFAYTGAFSVYAAHGKADKVWTVDLSNTYIDWAMANFALNGLNAGVHNFIAADVMAWLPTVPDNSMDLIICDPPTFSNSKKMSGIFDVQRDHPALLNQCLRILEPGGQIIFSTNNRKFRLYDHHIDTTEIQDITRQTTGFDFEGGLERKCYRLGKIRSEAASVWGKIKSSAD
ncbi:MAG: class I SAM-dependent methyltransferase [Pseudomonadota bacterium]